MVDITQILEEFPFLVPSYDFKEWNGIIIVEDEEVSVKITLPNFPDLENISVMCPIQWEERICYRLNTYQNLPTRRNNLIELLRYLKLKEGSVDNNFKEADCRADNVTTLQMFAKVLAELRQLGGDYVLGCNTDLSRVRLHAVDGRGVDHQIVVGLSHDYPSSPARVVDVDLPEASLSQLNQATTIIEIMNSFENIIESLQDFWIVYEEMKNNTWIIDPENPRLKDTHCRIIVGENISMLVVLNPNDVNSCPDIKFLGPENLVTPFINSVENQLKTSGWDEDAGMCDNLLRLLGLAQFPRRGEDVEADEAGGECCICFTLRPHDDAPLPAKVCNNPRCDSYFHIMCLAQWFQAVPTNEASFNLISGGCPSCGEKILCPITVT